MDNVVDFTEKKNGKSLGQLASELFTLRRRKDELNSLLKEVNKEISALEYKIINSMDDTGIDKLSVSEGTISKRVELYPKIEDKEAFINWAVENGYVGMIQGQVNRAVFREFFNETNEYPDGVDAYEKPVLSVRRSR